MRFVYFLWAKDQDMQNQHLASEIAVSIASVRRFMPDSVISVYLSEKFDYLVPFLDAFVSHTDKVVCDKRRSLLTKLFTLQKVLHSYKTAFLKHKGGTRVRPTSLAIRSCLDMAKEESVNMDFFNYPRLK